MSRADQPFSPEDELPDALREALSRLDEPGAQVPRELDRQILAEAKASFLRRRRFWLAARWSLGAVAAAAVLAIALHLFAPGFNANRTVAVNRRLSVNEAADVNHDGRVDILDAFILARKISHHELLDPAWDINGDGVIDQKDVDLIAGVAVQTAGPEDAR